MPEDKLYQFLHTNQPKKMFLVHPLTRRLAKEGMIEEGLKHLSVLTEEEKDEG